MALTSKKCFNHPERVAGAKCLECGNFFCGECITLHENRRICSNCLNTLSTDASEKRESKSHLTMVMATVGMLVLFMIFYAIGTKLIELGDRDVRRFEPQSPSMNK